MNPALRLRLDALRARGLAIEPDEKLAPDSVGAAASQLMAGRFRASKVFDATEASSADTRTWLESLPVAPLDTCIVLWPADLGCAHVRFCDFCEWHDELCLPASDDVLITD